MNKEYVVTIEIHQLNEFGVSQLVCVEESVDASDYRVTDNGVLFMVGMDKVAEYFGRVVSVRRVFDGL